LNPRKAYGSLYSSGIFTKIILTLLFLQIVILLVQNSSITIPQYLTKYILSRVFEDTDFKPVLSKLNVRLNGDIEFRDLYLKDKSGISLRVKYGNFKISLFEVISLGTNPLDSMNFSKIEISSRDNELIRFPELQLSYLNNKCLLLNFTSNISNILIKGSGIISSQFLSGSNERKFEIQNKLAIIKNFYEKNYRKINDLSFTNCTFVLSLPKNSTIFMEINSSSLKKRNIKYEFNDGILRSEIIGTYNYTKIYGIFDQIILKSAKQSINASGISLSATIANTENDPSLKLAHIGINSLSSDGLLSGSYGSFNLSYEKLNHNTELLFNTNTKSMVSCIKYSSFNKSKSIRGFAKIKPDDLDLHLNKESESLKIFKGDSLDITMHHNVDRTELQTLTSFKLKAKRFSALETPPGNFNFVGKIKSDFSIEVTKAVGSLGKSIVRGSYSQKWNPHKYEFIVKGNCHPPDINNWFKDWWKKIWIDFRFTEKIPYGDFKISGTWGGETGNSNTFGIIDSKELAYKGFHTRDSKVEIMVDQNSTYISTDYLTSSKGKIKGFLEFPRKHKQSPTLLYYYFDGAYPLNEARRIFGEEFEKSVEDLNASVLICNAKGSISHKATASNDGSKFNLQFRSGEVITYKGIEISNIEGVVEKLGSKTKGILSRFKIAEGVGQMNFEQDSNGSEDSLSFNFSLKDANKNILMNQVFLAKKNGLLGDFDPVGVEDRTELVEELEESSLSISLNAIGPLHNPLQFEGTGMLQLNESKISQINLLGGLSKGLSGLKMPLPSGALSFNELILPFEINNESMVFDKLTMNGPLSKVTAKGNFNLASGTVDIIAKLNLAGNLPIPIIKNLVQFADPLSRMTEIKITGDFKNPKWELLLTSE
jgi:hypothetical protein